MATKPSFNLPHLTKYLGTVNEDPDLFFMIFEHLANLQGWTNEKKVEILPMYLQGVALDVIFQLQSLNQLEALTYDQLKKNWSTLVILDCHNTKRKWRSILFNNTPRNK